MSRVRSESALLAESLTARVRILASHFRWPECHDIRFNPVNLMVTLDAQPRSSSGLLTSLSVLPRLMFRSLLSRMGDIALRMRLLEFAATDLHRRLSAVRTVNTIIHSSIGDET